MDTLEPGDEICIVFDDAPGQVLRATVSRVLSDAQEALGSEVADYVACWVEVSPDGESAAKTVMVGTDHHYYVDGRRVIITRP